MLVSHWASRRDTGLKDWYLSGIKRNFLVAKNVWLAMDNAKTCKCADREIQQLFTPESSTSKQLWDKIDQEELQAKLTSKGIKWKFIVERSMWRGG